MDKVLSSLRSGMTIKDACKAAGYSTYQVYKRRQKDPAFSKRFEECRNPKPKPTADMHITLKTRRKKKTPAVLAYWEAWEDAAVAGTLVKRIPAMGRAYRKAKAAA